MTAVHTYMGDSANNMPGRGLRTAKLGYRGRSLQTFLLQGFPRKRDNGKKLDPLQFDLLCELGVSGYLLLLNCQFLGFLQAAVNYAPS